MSKIPLCVFVIIGGRKNRGIRELMVEDASPNISLHYKRVHKHVAVAHTNIRRWNLSLDTHFGMF